MSNLALQSNYLQTHTNASCTDETRPALSFWVYTAALYKITIYFFHVCMTCVCWLNVKCCKVSLSVVMYDKSAGSWWVQFGLTAVAAVSKLWSRRWKEGGSCIYTNSVGLCSIHEIQLWGEQGT